MQHSKIAPLHSHGFYLDIQSKEYSAVKIIIDITSYWETSLLLMFLRQFYVSPTYHWPDLP